MERNRFDATVSRYSRRVFTFASYLLGDPAEAEDITQRANRAVQNEVIDHRVIPVAARGLGRPFQRLSNGISQGEQIYIFSIDGSDGNIAGLTALVNDGGEEAVVANLAGSIDPVLLGSMISHLGEMDFDQFMPGDDDDD